MTQKILVATLAVFIAGFGWGHIQSQATTSCVPASPFEGRVARIGTSSSGAKQYIVQTETDCTYIVSTSSYQKYALGNELSASGTIQPIHEIENEYAGYADYLDRNDIDATVRYPDIEVVSSRVSTSGRIRGYIEKSLNRFLAEPEGSVAAAMVLGDRGGIPEQIQEVFQRTGTAHILAISGLHISLLTGLLLFVCMQLPVSGIARTTIVVAVLWGYVALIGFPISATRAGIFWTVFLVARQARVLVSLATAIVLAAAILITLDPRVLFDVGFQLSFMAIIGIGLALFLFPKVQSYIGRALIISTGAFAATWPIISFHFGIVSLASIPLNLIVIPAASIFLIVVIGLLMVGSISGAFSMIIGLLARGIWKLVFLPSFAVDKIPLLSFSYTVPLWGVVIWYSVCALLVIQILKQQHRLWREVWVH